MTKKQQNTVAFNQKPLVDQVKKTDDKKGVNKVESKSRNTQKPKDAPKADNAVAAEIKRSADILKANEKLYAKFEKLKIEQFRLEVNFKREYESFIESHHKNKEKEIQNYYNIGVKYGFINSSENDYLDFVELANVNLYQKLESNELSLKQVLSKTICKDCLKEGFKLHSKVERRVACLNCGTTRSQNKTHYEISSNKYFEIKIVQLLLERIPVSKIAKVLKKDHGEVKRVKLKHFKLINDLIGTENIYSGEVTRIASSLKKFNINGVSNLVVDYNKIYKGPTKDKILNEEYLINNSLIKIDTDAILVEIEKKKSGIYLIESDSIEDDKKGIATLFITETGTSKYKRNKSNIQN